jgi:LPPG:FO 2-phospho-L-lactate transferase
MRVVLLAGGYGGARMAHGFVLLGAGVELAIVGNTADDIVLHGLHISPDLDTVMYTLAGLANPETGWGVRDETWSADAMLARFGAETWFRLGDRDLATHILRTARLRQGLRLTEVTGQLCRSLGLRARLLPMSDDDVRTKVLTPGGWLDFQDYFVRRGHRDDVLELRFDGIENARPTVEVLEAVGVAELVVIAPSNPFVSVGPILALPGMLPALLAAAAPVVAVSPIVAGTALRGPAGDMLRALGAEASSVGVAQLFAERYPGLVDTLVIDDADRADAERVAACGIEPAVRQTVMSSENDRRLLAQEIVRLQGG